MHQTLDTQRLREDAPSEIHPHIFRVAMPTHVDTRSEDPEASVGRKNAPSTDPLPVSSCQLGKSWRGNAAGLPHWCRSR